MARKRWSPVVDVTDSVLKLREKKKWQIALRRYVVESSPCYEYAPYFGLSISDIRTWFECQFLSIMSWENFGTVWQFEHVVPTHCFDWAKPEELRLCWNFTNLRAALIQQPPVPDPIATATKYFARLQAATGYQICNQMLAKLTSMQTAESSNERLLSFLTERKALLQQLAQFDAQAFAQLNAGQDAAEITKEILLLKKYSSSQKE